MAVDDSYTKSLLHFDGFNNTPNFTDESGKAWTSYSAYLDTSVYKFGTSSGLFNGGASLSTPDHADFNFGSGDFTVDFWLRPSSVGQGNSSVIFAKFSNATQYSPISITQGPGSYNILLYMSTGAGWNLVNAATIGTSVQNTWCHIAVSRQSTNVYYFFNGILINTVPISTNVLYSAATPVWIGSGNYASTYFAGNIDEFRISKGIARWTSSFNVAYGAYGWVVGNATRGRTRKCGNVDYRIS